MEKRSAHTSTYAALIITAAGSSRRMGEGEKKEYRSLNGKPVLIQTLLPFLETGFFSQVIITIPPGHKSRVETLLQQLPQEQQHWLDKISLMEGGESRQASVFAGLKACSSEPRFVLIHDGARPWSTAMLIRRVLFDTEEHGASIPIVPSTDAMKQISPSGYIHNHLARKETVCAQTPQGFSFQTILSAHRQAALDNTECIDDAEVYARFIGPVHTVEGERNNLKITYPDDFTSATNTTGLGLEETDPHKPRVSGKEGAL